MVHLHHWDGKTGPNAIRVFIIHLTAHRKVSVGNGFSETILGIAARLCIILAKKLPPLMHCCFDPKLLPKQC